MVGFDGHFCIWFHSKVGAKREMEKSGCIFLTCNLLVFEQWIAISRSQGLYIYSCGENISSAHTYEVGKDDACYHPCLGMNAYSSLFEVPANALYEIGSYMC